jgi:hypothetical protein
MKEKLANLVSICKSIAYLLFGAFTIVTFAKKDYIFGEIARLSAPYNETYIETSVAKFAPQSVIEALKNDSVKVYISEEQWKQLDGKLYTSKTEILDGMPAIATKVLHDFLVIEKEITDPITHKIYYIRGILLGKDKLGRDNWMYNTSETRTIY